MEVDGDVVGEGCSGHCGEGEVHFGGQEGGGRREGGVSGGEEEVVGRSDGEGGRRDQEEGEEEEEEREWGGFVHLRRGRTDRPKRLEKRDRGFKESGRERTGLGSWWQQSVVVVQADVGT